MSAYHFVGKKIFTVIRYGNVFGSRGSVVPLFLNQKKKRVLTVTDKQMTRFSIDLNECYRMVMWTLKNSYGGEIIVPKLKSYKIMDLAKAIDPRCKLNIIGIRPSEKIK